MKNFLKGLFNTFFKDILHYVFFHTIYFLLINLIKIKTIITLMYLISLFLI